MYRVLIARRYTDPHQYFESACTEEDGPIPLSGALDYIDDNRRHVIGWTDETRESWVYFVVSEEEYQSYWRDKVS